MVRRPFLLLELLISLGLLSLLLALLFRSFHQTTSLAQKAKPLYREIREEWALHTRLNELIREATLGAQQEGERSGFFAAEGQAGGGFSSLLFSRNAGIDDDPHFCGEVLHRLYVDPDSTNHLVLATWPSPHHWQEDPPLYRKELLFSHPLLAFTIELYEPHLLEAHAPQEAKEGGPLFGWQREWLREWEELPALIRLHLSYHDSRGEPSLFSIIIPLSQADKPVLYLQEAG